LDRPRGLPRSARRRLFGRFARAATIDLGPLRAHRDFRLLYSGQLVSFFGNTLTTVALLYQVYALTRSPLAVGLLGFAQLAPLLLLALLGGALADVIDRRRLVQLTELSLAGLSAALLINALLPAPQLWLLYVVGILAAGLDALQRPALTALVPRLVEREELVGAVALTKLSQSLGQIVGPALAGLLIAAASLPSTYGIDVLTFAVSLVALHLMRASPPPRDGARSSLHHVREGLRYVRSRLELLGTYLVDFVATFFGWPTAVFPALAVLYTSAPGAAGGIPAATALGLLYAAPAVGSLVASATSGWTRHVHRRGRGILLAVLTWGLAITGLGLAPSLPLALACLVLMGGANLVSAVFRSALTNETTPDALRGRLAGIELICYTSGPTLGDLETGAVATIFTPNLAVLSGGLLCVAGVGLLAVMVPSLRRYDRRHASAEPPSASVAEASLSSNAEA
jgi:MFS family permease